MQIEMLNPLPADLPVIVGDALQCLRHSLDNLAFSLALANKRTLTAKQEEEVLFPIHDHRVTERTRGIQLMSKSVKDDLSSLAPDPARLVLDQHPLWLLDKAVNWDRHRAIRCRCQRRDDRRGCPRWRHVDRGFVDRIHALGGRS